MTNKLISGSNANYALRYSNYINEYLYRLIPENKKILDVGCNSGNLGEKLIKEKNCKVWGVDFSKKVISIAEKKLHKAKQFDLETYKLPFLGEKFDVLLFADVLEHLRYPELILSRYRKMLNKNGTIIVSAPNVANINIRLKLLLGKWDYTESGILDKTHFKFYTYDTLKSLIESTGYKIIKVDSTPGFKFFFLRGIKGLLRLQELACKIYPKLFAKQFIFICQKTI